MAGERPPSEIKVIQPHDPAVDRRVIYECNFSVEAAVVPEFAAYLRQHMREIVGLDDGKLFDRATLCVAENEGHHDAGRAHLCARYRARSRFRLQEYFDKAGDRLRKDMLEKWGGRFEVQRRILAVDSAGARVRRSGRAAVAGMEAALVPRQGVLEFGCASVLAPLALDSVAAVQAAARGLAGAASAGPDGAKYVSAAAAAGVLDMAPEVCQLLLDVLAAVGGRAARAAAPGGGVGGVDAHDLGLFLMAQLYNRESHKPETQDHWPEPAPGGGAAGGGGAGEAAAWKAAGRGPQPGSPGGAASSRLLLKSQLAAAQRSAAAFARGYREFLARHARSLLELAMDDPNAALAWHAARAAQVQQAKAAQLQLAQPAAAAAAAAAAAQRSPPPQQRPAEQQAPGGDSEMTPVDDAAPAAAVAPAGGGAPAGEERDESMQSSPPRRASDDGTTSQQQQQQQPPGTPSASPAGSASPVPAGLRSPSPSGGGGGGGAATAWPTAPGSLARSCSAVPPVSLSAAEFDRLGFLLELRAPGAAAAAPAAAAAAAGEAPVGSPAAAAGPGGGAARLSACVPGYGARPALLMEELLAWMAGAWGQEPQQHAHQQQLHRPAAAAAGGGQPNSSSSDGGGAAAAAGDAAPAAGALDGCAAAWLGMEGISTSPPRSSSSGGGGTLPHPSSPAAAAGAAGGMNGALTGGDAGGGLGLGLGLSHIRVVPAGGSGGASSGGSGASSSSSGGGAAAAPRGLVAVAAGRVSEQLIAGVHRGTVVRGPSDVPPGAAGELVIRDCSEAHIYVLAPLRLARITNCTDCTVCLGAVGALLRLDGCERLQLTAAAGQVLAVSCHSCVLHLGTPRPPALLGDCRFNRLAPFNTRYEALPQHLAAAGIAHGPSLWDQPLLLSGGGGGGGGGSSGTSGGAPGGSGGGAAAQRQQRPGAASPSSPHTHGSSGAGPGGERRGWGGGAKPVSLLPPEEFLPLVVPFRGTPGPLAGGAAHSASTHWLPGSHKAAQGPLPALPFPLPEPYDAALAQQSSVVGELRGRIRGSGLDEPRRSALQGVIQAYFREWLHSSGAIRQVYDLSKLEGDEVGAAGGSPPAALRDTSQLRRVGQDSAAEQQRPASPPAEQPRARPRGAQPPVAQPPAAGAGAAVAAIAAPAEGARPAAGPAGAEGTAPPGEAPRQPSIGEVLSLVVQRGTALPPELLLTSPVVRLHVVHAGTDAGGGGRPALTTVDNDTPCPRAALLGHLPPIQTRPAELAGTPGGCGLCAEWGQELCADLAPRDLAAGDALLLLEVLQLPSGFGRFQHHAAAYRHYGGTHRVAWAFLRLAPLMPRLDAAGGALRLDLRLHRYDPAALGAGGAWWSHGGGGPHPANTAKAAWASWRTLGLNAAAGDESGSPPRGGGSPGSESPRGGQRHSPKRGRARYPGFLQVVLCSRLRPAPEGLLVATDPAAGLRPELPAGFGSGFERGCIPWDLLRGARTPGGGGGAAGAGASAGGAAAAAGAGCASVLAMQQLALESQLHRPSTHPCQLPNALLAEARGPAGGVSVLAASHDGRWLAVAAGDATGRFQVRLYHCLSGAPAAELGWHAGLVYGLTWAHDDSALASASADFTAKLWHLPRLPAPLGAQGAPARADDGACRWPPGWLAVLQHRCHVYDAVLHPLRTPLGLVAATGAADGYVRLWAAESGQMLACVRVCGAGAVNCLAFGQLGSRVFAGDAAGRLTELAVDLGPLAAAEANMADATHVPCAPPAAAAEAEAVEAARASPEPAAAARDGCASPVAAALRRGSPAAQALGGQELLKALRVSADLAGGSVVALALHPGGHQLLALTKAGRAAAPGGRAGCSEVAVLDLKLLLAARRLPGVRCSAPCKLAVSPDGNFVVWGDDEGGTVIWHVESGSRTPLTHAELGGAPVGCVAWSACFHALALSSLSPLAPIRVLGWDPGQPAVRLTPSPPQSARAGTRFVGRAQACAADGVGRTRHVLPDMLTPSHVHALLADLRASAAQRGLYGQPGGPQGHHLVVVAAHGNSAGSHTLHGERRRPARGALRGAEDAAGAAAEAGGTAGEDPQPAPQLDPPDAEGSDASGRSAPSTPRGSLAAACGAGAAAGAATPWLQAR
ncbi:tbccd1 [Scenedesmus sp. PABB004]|nr:tbccd1 [Scenedesmus sp. PABB004]